MIVVIQSYNISKTFKRIYVILNLVGKCATHTCAKGYKCVLKGEVITCVIACKYQVEEIHFMG